MPRLQQHLAVAGQVDPVVRHRWPQRVPADPLEARAIVARHDDARVEIESVPVRMARPRHGWRERQQLRGGPAPRGIAADLITWANGTGAPILSLDVPSGVDATTGETPGVVVRPRWTMTLALPKTGLRPEHAGQLVLADIGIPAEAFRRAGLVFVSPFGDRFRVPLTIS